MLTNGSLADTNLRGLLETAQAERATGTLTVRDGNGASTTLYFLFGHLFHAVGDGILGDEAVVRSLAWSAGDFDFDAKAKLPADETVRGSIGDLVQQAETRGEAPAAAEPEPAPEAPPPAPAPEAVAAPEPAPAPAPRSEREPEPPPPPPPAPEPEPEPAPAAHEEPAAPGGDDEALAPTPRRGVRHRPSPNHGRESVPVPAGQVIYDSLKTSFVDFPRLITTLERESHTGYVRLLTEKASGLILFREGAALECAYDAGADPSPTLGRQALMDFNEEVTNGQGVLDVVSLTPELVAGLHELTVARPMYSDLYASWVDSRALLRFLEERSLSGSVMVRAKSGTGVIILTHGKLTGAYTTESRDISESADGVLALCKEPDAVIEVKAADETPREPLDVDAVVGSRKVPTGTTQTDMPIYRPEPAAAAPAPEAVPPAHEIPAWQPEPQAAPAWGAPAGNTAPTNPTQPVWTAESAAPAAPVAPVPPAPAIPEAPPPPAAPNVDWDAVLVELQAITEDALGNRSRKVKDVLVAADRSPAGMEMAIDQIPTISILFVDSSRLESLAHDLRNKLRSYLA